MFDYPFPRRAWERGKTLTPSSSLLISNEYLYTGRRLDPETGLQLNRNRFYASHLERWVNRDYLGYLDGTNLYQYVAGNPINYLDPTEELWRIIIVVIVGIGKLIGRLLPKIRPKRLPKPKPETTDEIIDQYRKDGGPAKPGEPKYRPPVDLQPPKGTRSSTKV